MNKKSIFIYLAGLFSGVLLCVGVVYYIGKVYLPNQIRENLENPMDEAKRLNQKADLSLKLVKLSDTIQNYNLSATKKKIIFMNYWENWCAPCVAELPSIDSLYKDYKNDVEFVIISKGEEAPNLKIASKYSLPFYSLKSSLPVQFDKKTIPQTFIIKDGMIIFNQSSANWNDKSFRKYLDSLIIN